MSFFQNVFDQEYQGYLVLSDRKLSPTFIVPSNKNTQSNQVAWNPGPYDFSSNSILEFNFCLDSKFKNWSKIQINVSGASAANTTPNEVVSILNSNSAFSSLLVASVVKLSNSYSVGISKNQKKSFKFYFSNSGAEKVLGFNNKAGVSEIPSYFERHTIENRLSYPDSVGMLIKLDESDTTDRVIIERAGFDYESMQQDWQLLKGRAPGLFTFKKITLDSSGRITEIIEYPAGAAVGDFAKKINHTYSGSYIHPNQTTEIPYLLKEEDMVNPT